MSYLDSSVNGDSKLNFMRVVGIMPLAIRSRQTLSAQGLHHSSGVDTLDTGEKNFAQMSKCAVAARHHCEAVGILLARTETERQTIIMKYALLVHESQEYFDRRKDSTSIAAGRAYGEALQAAGVFVGGAGLESPETATTVSLRDGKRHVHDGPYAETKEFLAGFAIIEVPNLDEAF